MQATRARRSNAEVRALTVALSRGIGFIDAMRIDRLAKPLMTVASISLLQGCTGMHYPHEWVTPSVVNGTHEPLLLIFQTNESREAEDVRVVLPPGGTFAHDKVITVRMDQLEGRATAECSAAGSDAEPVRLTFSIDASSYKIVRSNGALVPLVLASTGAVR